MFAMFVYKILFLFSIYTFFTSSYFYLYPTLYGSFWSEPLVWLFLCEISPKSAMYSGVVEVRISPHIQTTDEYKKRNKNLWVKI